MVRIPLVGQSANAANKPPHSSVPDEEERTDVETAALEIDISDDEIWLELRSENILVSGISIKMLVGLWVKGD